MIANILGLKHVTSYAYPNRPLQLKSLRDRLITISFVLLLLPYSIHNAKADGLFSRNYQSQLVAAISAGDVSKVNTILSDKNAIGRLDFKKINTNTSHDDTFLTLAARKGNVEIMHLLLAAKPLFINQTKDNQTKRENTAPLHIASSYGNENMVIELLNQGAKIDLSNGAEESPLYLAAQGGHLRVVKVLLDRGAEINWINGSGTTPLYTAVVRHHLEIVKFLLSRGAKTDITTEDEASLLLHASQHSTPEILEELLKSNQLNLRQEIKVALKFRSHHLIERLQEIQKEKYKNCKKKLVMTQDGISILAKNVENLGEAELEKQVKTCYDSILAKKALEKLEPSAPAECSICLDCLFGQQKLLAAPCGHLHCKDCLKQLLISPLKDARGRVTGEPVCPLCRGEICNRTLLEVRQPPSEVEHCTAEEPSNH